MRAGIYPGARTDIAAAFAAAADGLATAGDVDGVDAGMYFFLVLLGFAFSPETSGQYQYSQLIFYSSNAQIQNSGSEV